VFIAHLPAGYLSSRLIERRIPLAGAAPALWLGSVFPDVDLLWFYVVDKGAVHHHAYVTHLPAVWLSLVVLIALIAAVSGRRAQSGRAGRTLTVAAAFVSGALLHCVLDTFVGDVRWLWPWSSEAFSLFTVPARYEWWVLSFLLHWTFAVEVVLCALAAIVWWRHRHRARGADGVKGIDSGSPPEDGMRLYPAA
jgi:inner membrane protein